MEGVLHRRHTTVPIIFLMAALINLMLFYFIYRLVTPDHVDLPEYETLQFVDFIRLKRPPKEPEPQRREKPPEKPKPEEPPEPKKMVTPRPNKPRIHRPTLRAPDVDLPAMHIAGGPVLGDFEPAPMESNPGDGLELDMNAVPIFRVEPLYPSRAMRKGIGGVVTVEFIITTTGRVTDPVIIDAKPSGIFDRAVLNAIKKWKFKPRVVNGEAVARRARQAIRFSLKQ